jgi:hypothetical protein
MKIRINYNTGNIITVTTWLGKKITTERAMQNLCAQVIMYQQCNWLLCYSLGFLLHSLVPLFIIGGIGNKSSAFLLHVFG